MPALRRRPRSARRGAGGQGRLAGGRDAWTSFESWSFGAIAQEPERFERAMRDMCEATPEQCRSGEWAHLHEKAPEPLAQRTASAREASLSAKRLLQLQPSI